MILSPFVYVVVKIKLEPHTDRLGKHSTTQFLHDFKSKFFKAIPNIKCKIKLYVTLTEINYFIKMQEFNFMWVEYIYLSSHCNTSTITYTNDNLFWSKW